MNDTISYVKIGIEYSYLFVSKKKKKQGFMTQFSLRVRFLFTCSDFFK